MCLPPPGGRHSELFLEAGDERRFGPVSDAFTQFGDFEIAVAQQSRRASHALSREKLDRRMADLGSKAPRKVGTTHAYSVSQRRDLPRLEWVVFDNYLCASDWIIEVELDLGAAQRVVSKGIDK